MRLISVETHKANTTKAPVETSGKVKDFVNKVKDKFTKKKSTKKTTANDNDKIGRSLQRMMAQYAKLKESGKGDSREAKRLGAAIGKIKNSLRGPRKAKEAVK